MRGARQTPVAGGARRSEAERPVEVYVKPGSFSFSGRARRREFWFMFFSVLVLSVVLIILFTVARLFAVAAWGADGLVLSQWLENVFTIPLVVWAYAVQVRRCHDLGWSGWCLLFPIVSGIAYFVGLLSGAGYVICVSLVYGTAVSIVFWIRFSRRPTRTQPLWARSEKPSAIMSSFYRNAPAGIED